MYINNLLNFVDSGISEILIMGGATGKKNIIKGMENKCVGS